MWEDIEGFCVEEEHDLTELLWQMCMDGTQVNQAIEISKREKVENHMISFICEI